jgi:hypothetical protein
MFSFGNHLGFQTISIEITVTVDLNPLVLNVTKKHHHFRIKTNQDILITRQTKQKSQQIPKVLEDYKFIQTNNIHNNAGNFNTHFYQNVLSLESHNRSLVYNYSARVKKENFNFNLNENEKEKDKHYFTSIEDILNLFVYHNQIDLKNNKQKEEKNVICSWLSKNLIISSRDSQQRK